ncbi:nucleotidyltransferase family protein [Clostridium chauvoei]|uniref:Nucleotidyltransferase family protein n=3 Tax=Clostridium chauvoei TaxID=46867 RepID=S6EJV7_9CLOT|nr:nucleotidyltransferase family protein [Clostridium chauvoei]ATD54843.1 hypothetical protein BTM20_06170 [Clostridium chauvoei]ATD57477.1 hypothetical protein BTM21_06890 [Clostridium chauvoei]MBX7281153.1 nucleotidyltransferase family protein [Clostridium chauvoei]MBX7283671.1 nucleotidyltransferase family protein [Clostridium chauvoei]MBX7286279.1 nucleotidyltransferase family protein [Clostridium chauvoei]
MFNTLQKVARELNKSNIRWAIGASILLKEYKIINKVNDIDIIVDIKDVKKLDSILKNIGIRKEGNENLNYSTKYFYEYVVDGIDIDVMADFTINHENGKYIVLLDEKSITSYKSLNGVIVPFMSLEDWYIIYQLIKGRDKKVSLIEKYLKENGIKHRELIERALVKDLPGNIKSRLENIIN